MPAINIRWVKNKNVKLRQAANDILSSNYNN